MRGLMLNATALGRMQIADSLRLYMMSHCPEESLSGACIPRVRSVSGRARIALYTVSEGPSSCECSLAERSCAAVLVLRCATFI